MAVGWLLGCVVVVRVCGRGPRGAECPTANLRHNWDGAVPQRVERLQHPVDDGLQHLQEDRAGPLHLVVLVWRRRHFACDALHQLIHGSRSVRSLRPTSGLWGTITAAMITMGALSAVRRVANTSRYRHRSRCYLRQPCARWRAPARLPAATEQQSTLHEVLPALAVARSRLLSLA